MKKHNLAASIGAITLASTMATVPHIYAQQPEANAIEEIIVTGSNIRRKRDFDTPSPIQTVGIEEIKTAGAGQIQDLLRLLPVNTGSEISISQSDRQGTSQFNIRGLGVGGTLTLINGRRAGVSTAESGGVFYTDINQYPTNMIERIEVLTDGASATYGSEAVGGVVNIITRNRFEGLELGVEYRDATNGAFQINGAFGTSFDGGHFTTFVNYYTQDGNFRGDFDFINERSNADPLNTSSSFDSGTGAGRYQAAVDNGDGTFLRTGDTVADPNCGEANSIGVVNTFVSDDNCRYNFIDQRRLIAEEDRFQIFSQFTYDLNDSVNIFSELSYSNNEVRDAIGGAVLRTTTDDGGFYVSGSHPFNYFIDNAGTLEYNPTAVQADPTQAVGVIFRGRPLTAFDGDLADDLTRQFDNTRAVFGTNIDINDSWSLNTSYLFARTKFTDVQPRSYNADAFRAAIASGDWNPFFIAASQPDAVSIKDGVTTAGNDARDLALFSTNRVFVRESNQSVFDATLSGDVFEFSNGNIVQVAVGFQFRDFTYSDLPDSLSVFALDGRGDPVVTIDDANQDVYAIFGETYIPATDDLEIQLAVRYEDYGDGEGGDTFNPKIGIKYDLGESGVQVRGSWGTSFRAPTIRQIEGSVNSGTLEDPADALNPGDACPGPNDDLANNNAAQILLGGNLTPEKSNNYNLGISYQADFGFTGSLDYFNYQYTDTIQPGQSFQDIVSNECSTGVYVPDPRVGRDAAGQLNNVTSNFLNLGAVDVNGLDVSLSYALEDILNGTLLLDAKATYIATYDIDILGDGNIFEGAGNRNNFIGTGSIPDLRANFGATWRTDLHTAALTLRYIGGYSDATPTDAGDDIDSQTVIDVQYGITLSGLLGQGETNLSIGVNNLFDEEPPEITSDRLAYDNEVHDPRGRIFYIRAKHTF